MSSDVLHCTISGIQTKQEYVLKSDFYEELEFVALQMAEMNKRMSVLEDENRNLRTLLAGPRKKNTERAAKLYMHLKMTGEPLFRTEASKLLDNKRSQTAVRAMEECQEIYEDVVLRKHERTKQLYLVLMEGKACSI